MADILITDGDDDKLSDNAADDEIETVEDSPVDVEPLPAPVQVIAEDHSAEVMHADDHIIELSERITRLEERTSDDALRSLVNEFVEPLKEQIKALAVTEVVEAAAIEDTAEDIEEIADDDAEIDEIEEEQITEDEHADEEINERQPRSRQVHPLFRSLSDWRNRA